MKPAPSAKEIRQTFLDFFRNKQHEIVRSAPVIPAEDPTLLFTNAGMNQFKDVFLGTGKRPYKRAADTQKCIRASGKHNDLEDVGRDTYHHTFFEMLGNWSFGDYYKEEAIGWAWELLTSVWGLPKDRLYATIFTDDDEAYNIWKNYTDIDPTHIQRHGAKDNFWEMGETGPCGPCSEIHIDLTPDKSGGPLVNKGDARVMEIWNLVFIQYNRNSKGELDPLPAKHVDTGMGFERITAVLQGKTSNYDTDVFSPLIEHISQLTGKSYTATLEGETDIAIRVIADHLRTLSFAIADGATPSNEGRGYVLRRILRRAVRYAGILGVKEASLYKLVPTLVASMGEVFPELSERQSLIEKVIHAEEDNFLQTLERGIEIFNEIAGLVKQKGDTLIPGSEAFKLYDTYGFPLDLTRLMASEIGLSVDEAGFEEGMNAQKDRARKDRKKKMEVQGTEESDWIKLSSGKESQFKGYQSLKEEAKLRKVKKAGNELMMILDKTPFYAESGGQVGDRGTIENAEYRFLIRDTQKEGDWIVHYAGSVIERATGNEISVDELQLKSLSKEVVAHVDETSRLSIMRNHTATHLLHAALRQVLGEHVQQKGSLVNDEKLRFDFSHFEKVSEEELHRIESLVNEEIRNAHEVEKHLDVPFEEAKAMGALAFFGDKYGDMVRVVEVPGFSIEFCGGTHLDNIGQIGLFKIIAESSIASGIRRIEAITGKVAEAYVRKTLTTLSQLKQSVGAQSEDEIIDKVKKLLDEKRALEKALEKERLDAALNALDSLLDNAETVGNGKVIAAEVSASGDALRQLGEAVRAKLKTGVALLYNIQDEKVSLVASVSDDLKSKVQAGKLVGEVAKMMNGGGGGRPELATAGAKDPSKLPQALAKYREVLTALLN